MTPIHKMNLREQLALIRTYQAKERTILAYIRTGLAFIGVGLFIYKFMDMDQAVKTMASTLFMLPGVYVTILGIYKILIHHRGRKDLEENYMVIDDDV